MSCRSGFPRVLWDNVGECKIRGLRVRRQSGARMNHRTQAGFLGLILVNGQLSPSARLIRTKSISKLPVSPYLARVAIRERAGAL